MHGCSTRVILKKFAALVALSMAVLIGIPASVGGHAAAADQLTGKLVITGASTLAPLIAEIGKRFEVSHPRVRIDVQTGGSSRGVADARKGSPTSAWSRARSRTTRGNCTRSPSPATASGSSCTRQSGAGLTNEQVMASTRAKSRTGTRSAGKTRRSPSSTRPRGGRRSNCSALLQAEERGCQGPRRDRRQRAGHQDGGRQSRRDRLRVDRDGRIRRDARRADQAAADRRRRGVDRERAEGIFPLSRPLNLVTGPRPRARQGVHRIRAIEGRADIVREQNFVPLAN